MIIVPLLCVVAGSCGTYANFTLPILSRRDRAELAVKLEPDPVLRRSREHDVLNPSVVRLGAGLYNLYSEFDGHTWHTALATSIDGVTWIKQQRVLSPDPKTWEGDYIAANGSALFDDGEWLYWYQAGPNGIPRIGLARSHDGRAWRKERNPVLETGPRGSWDERGVADPYVLKLNGIFYIYYLGQNRARQQQIGLARSPDGVHWTKLRSNPVLTVPRPGTQRADENGLGEPAVWQAEGWYWMLYTGRDAHERRALLPMRSSDGVHWIASGEPIHGVAAWDSQVVCDPTVLSEGAHTRLWFGGGDAARPDENLNGQIGVGTLQMGPPVSNHRP